ncbi:MAG: HD-GYP domain-containing protein [Phycisphaerales bacterium JB059]
MSPQRVSELLAEIERKDLSTAAHTWRVVLYARALCEAFGVDHETIALVTQGAAMHDLGKLDVPDEILQKPDRLTPDEFEVIKVHPVSGYARMIEMNVDEEPILDLVRYHHERWDGLGYPFNLKGESIPMGARFFAVIDAFDAMTSIRPYRRELGDDAAARALEEIEAGAGTRYAPEASAVFTELFRTGKLDHILHYFNDEATVPAFHEAQMAQIDRLAKRRTIG